MRTTSQPPTEPAPSNGTAVLGPPRWSVAAARSRERTWINQLAAETDALTATKRYRDWLAATARHWRYSPLNCALIHIQRPDATTVAGRSDWGRRGRAVAPGAKPLWILAPGGGRRFVGVAVFDLRDTTGPRLSVDSWTLTGGSRHLRQVERAAGLLGITLQEDPYLRGVSGCCLPGRVVRVARGLSPAERTATLVHEYGHALLAHADGSGRGRRTDEAEAEGVAWIVMKSLGLRSTAPQYLAHLGVGAVELHRSFRRIAQASRDILWATRAPQPGKPRSGRSRPAPPGGPGSRSCVDRSSRAGRGRDADAV